MSEPQQPAPEEMRLPSPAEVVLSSAQLLVTLAADAIDARERLDEAQLAIDAVDALLPVVERLVTADQLRQFRRAVAELQLAYVEAAKPAAGAGSSPPATPAPTVEPPERSKIWTPRGDV
ncbi:MAG: hypothetical protein QOG33_14 [Gaiellales bacterium]|jgi:hypothetical protein|nr:hypothetical protein [Gaiellales bacterium]